MKLRESSVRALRIARAQGSKTFELRTALSLARVTDDIGDLHTAVAGFDGTARSQNLEDARRLLDSRASGARNSTAGPLETPAASG